MFKASIHCLLVAVIMKPHDEGYKDIFMGGYFIKITEWWKMKYNTGIIFPVFIVIRAAFNYWVTIYLLYWTVYVQELFNKTIFLYHKRILERCISSVWFLNPFVLMFKRSFSKFMINRSNSVDFSRWFITPPPPLPDCVYICLNDLSERLNYFLAIGEFNRAIPDNYCLVFCFGHFKKL